jgi:putative ABC transport system permease protein
MGKTSRMAAIEGMKQDIRYSLRMMRRNPGFVGIVVLIADLKDLQEQSSLLQGISVWSKQRFNLRGSAEPEVTNGVYVSANFFSVMQSPMFLGTGFAENADVPGRNHVAVLGYDFWRNRFAADRNLIGKKCADRRRFLHGCRHRAQRVPLSRGGHQCLGSLAAEPRATAAKPPRVSGHRTNAARRGTATSEPAVKRNFRPAGPGLSGNRCRTAQLADSFKNSADGQHAKSLLIAFGVVGFVFLIACSNVSSLLLSRMTARQREIATRVALGARQMSLLRQFFIENLILAVLGAVLAIFAARWSILAIVTFGNRYLPGSEHFQPDATVFGFSLALATVAAAGISVVIAWGSTKVNLSEALKEGGKTSAPGRASGRRQRILVISQIAVAFLLLTGAGALIQNLITLSHVNPGFNPDHVLTMRIPRAHAKSTEQSQITQFLQEALASVRALPGVQSAGVITYLPMQDWGTNIPVEIRNSVIVPGAEPSAEVRAISSQYYSAMSIPILAGHGFKDGEEREEVVVVNRRFTEKYFPNQDAIGKQIRLPGAERWATIVGIAVGLDSAPRPEVDVPYSQSLWTFLTSNMTLAVQTAQSPLSMARDVQRALYSVDRDQGVFDVKAMADIVTETQADERFLARLLALFSGLALVPAACGLFGQMFHAVSQQRHEIGVRIALGAQRRDVLKLVLTQSAKLTGLGMAIGIGASLLLKRFIAYILYGGQTVDPFVWIFSVLLLAAVALLACYLPARRAMGIDPALAFRCE